MYRFEQVYIELAYLEDETDHSEMLYQVVKLMEKYYLTSKERMYLQCLRMYYQNKKQRELSILLNIDQPNLSAKFAKLRKKLRAIAEYLLHADIIEILRLNKENKYNVVLTPRQYEVLMYLLAGNKAYHISKFLKVSPVAIHQTVTYLRRKLPSESLPRTFLARIGSI